MPYSSNQQRYVTVFMQHIRSSLMNNSTEDVLATLLGNASTGVSGLSSAAQGINHFSKFLGIAAIIAAPASLGTSLAAAGVIVTGLQVGLQVYRWVQKQRGEEATFLSDEARIDIARLTLEILFGEVATLLARQYQHFIDTVASEKGVNTLASFAAKEVLREWLNLTQKKQLISLEALIQPLVTPSTMVTTTVEVLPQYKNKLAPFFTKGVYALAITTSFDKNQQTWSIFSRPEAQPRYGYRVVDFSQAASSIALSIQEIQPYLCAEFYIDSTTVQTVKDYLKSVREKRDTRSFNTYLSERYGSRLIAACHDDSLSGVDLRQGNFSEVNFRRANLRGCLLEKTQWGNAHLERAIFGDTQKTIFLNKSHFQETHLEGTQWENVNFSSCIMLQTKLNGASLVRCQLGTLQHPGSTWDLAAWEDMPAPDEIFLSSLTEEHQARIALENRVDTLSATLREQTQRWVNLDGRIAMEETQRVAFETQLIAQQRAIQGMKINTVLLSDLQQDIIFLKEALVVCQQAQTSTTDSRMPMVEWLKEHTECDSEEEAFQLEISQAMDNLRVDLEHTKGRVTALESRMKAVEPQWPSAIISGKHRAKPLPLHALLGEYQRAFENPRLQNTLHYYIEPTALPFKGADIEPYPLCESLESFSKDDRNILLIHGEVGAGKSSVARLYQKALWDAWQDETFPIPILIELKQVSTDNPNFLKDQLKIVYGYTDKQIETLQKTYRFMIILDGLDECPNSAKRYILQDCEIHRWQAKVLFTARTEWLYAQENYRNILTSNTETDMTYTLSECFIAPFSPAQIDVYLEKRYSDDACSWTIYRDFLYKTEELSRMAVSPVMLHILCEVLPILIQQFVQSNKTSHYTRFSLYDIFLNAWFEREIIKKRISGKIQTHDDEVLKVEFLYYTQALAFTMLCEKTLLVKKRHQKIMPKKTLGAAVITSQKDPWSDFFNSADNLTAQHSCPLSLERFDINGQRYHAYQFIHKSFMEHAASTWLWDALKNPEGNLQTRLEAWNHRFLTEEQGIVTFLAERLETSVTRQQEEMLLLEMILITKTRSEMAQAASSAISVLNRAHTDFQQLIPDHNLSGIQIPQADLSGAFLEYFNFSYSNVARVIFHYAVLYQANFYRANLKDTHFIEGNSFVLTEQKAYAFAQHPLDSDVVAYSQNNDIIVLRLSTGRFEKRLFGHTSEVRSLAFTFDGSRVLLASGSRDKTIRLWDVKNTVGKECVKIFEGHTDDVSNLAFTLNEDGILASGSKDKTIRLWNTKETTGNQCFKILEGHVSRISSLVFGPNNILASGGADKTIRLWNINAEQGAENIKILTGHTNPIEILAFSIDGTLASGGFDGIIRLWNIKVAPDKACFKTLAKQTEGIASLGFSATGILASGGGNKIICLWDINAKQGAENIKIFTGHASLVSHLAFNSGGALVSMSWDNTIRLWDIRQEGLEAHLQTFEGHASPVKNLAFGPDGLLASGGSSMDNTICLWNTKSMAEKKYIKTLKGHKKNISKLVFNSDGILASSSSDNTIRLWNKNSVAGEECLKVLEGHISWVSSLAFGPGGVLASGSNDNTIRLWNTTGTVGKECVKTLVGHTKEVISLAFSPDGVLASGSKSEAIRLWNFRESIGNECLKILEGHRNSIMPSLGGALSLAFGSDRILASGGADNMICLWNIKNAAGAELLRTLEGHTNSISNLVFSPDGKWLFSGSNKEILCWHTQHWDRSPINLPFGTFSLAVKTNSLAITQENSVIVLDLTDFPQSLHWRMSAPPKLQLKYCNIFEAQGLTSVTQKLLQAEGVVSIPEELYTRNAAPTVNADLSFSFTQNPHRFLKPVPGSEKTTANTTLSSGEAHKHEKNTAQKEKEKCCVS